MGAEPTEDRDVGRARAVAAAITITLPACACAGGHGGQYGYSSTSKYKTVELLHERSAQPSFGKHSWPIEGLHDYLTSQGVGCPNYAQAFNWGTDNRWAANCFRATTDLFPLYQLRVFESSDAKHDSIDGAFFACDLGHREYWIEGPDWAVATNDKYQLTKAANDASSHALATAMAHATGARLYSAC